MLRIKTFKKLILYVRITITAVWCMYEYLIAHTSRLVYILSRLYTNILLGLFVLFFIDLCMCFYCLLLHYSYTLTCGYLHVIVFLLQRTECGALIKLFLLME